jgi:hypothetical protein
MFLPLIGLLAGSGTAGWTGCPGSGVGVRLALDVEKIIPGGTLGGGTVLATADPGRSPLAPASVFPVQIRYEAQGNLPVFHGKEKVYCSIP